MSRSLAQDSRRRLTNAWERAALVLLSRGGWNARELGLVFECNEKTVYRTLQGERDVLVGDRGRVHLPYDGADVPQCGDIDAAFTRAPELPTVYLLGRERCTHCFGGGGQ